MSEQDLFGPIKPNAIRTVNSDGSIPGVEEVIQSPIITTHPFDDPEFLRFIAREFPDSLDAVKTATRPTISDQPDEFETWESAQILTRKIRFGFEGDSQYLSRLLYEESYSVNQHPGIDNPPIFQGVPGLTPGGLVSHFYFEGKMNRSTIEDVIVKPLVGNTVSESLQGMDDFWEKMDLLDIVAVCTYARSRFHVNLHDLARDPSRPYTPNVDSVGFRLLKMLQAAPEMMEKTTDMQLKETAEVRPYQMDQPTPLTEVLTASWKKFSRLLFEEPASYEDPKIKQALSELLFVRTHPKMQIFYKYLSPSGYLNTPQF